MSNAAEAHSADLEGAENSTNEMDVPISIRKYFPPTWLITISILMILGVVAMFQSSAAIEDRIPLFDKAVQNLVFMLVIILIGLMHLGWYLLGFPKSFAFRLLTTLGTFGLVVGFFSAVEMKQNTGSIWPASFKWRWTPYHDEQLAKVGTTSTEAIDLTYAIMDGQFDPNFSQFLGSNRDGVIDVDLDTDWKENPPRVVWKQKIGAGWAGFSAANGYALTLEQRGDEELTTCYDILTGKIVWSHAEKGVRHKTIPGGIGPRSTPTIDPETGYVYTIGGTGILLCLDGKDGSVKWRKEILREVGSKEKTELLNVAWGRSGSPLLADGKVIVPGGGTNGKFDSLIAYNKPDGKEIWRSGTDQISYSSPMLMKYEASGSTYDIIVIINEKSVTGHDVETGKLLWSHPRDGRSNGPANVGQPVAYPENRLLLTKGYGIGAELIEIKADGGDVGPESNFTVTSIWNNKRYLRTKMSSALRSGDYAFGLTEEVLECIDVINNKRIWRGERYGHGQVLLVGKNIIVLSEDGSVALVPADPAEFQEVGRVDEVLHSITWNTICFHQFERKWYLLIRNGEEAACLEIAVVGEDSKQID